MLPIKLPNEIDFVQPLNNGWVTTPYCMESASVTISPSGLISNIPGYVGRNLMVRDLTQDGNIIGILDYDGNMTEFNWESSSLSLKNQKFDYHVIDTPIIARYLEIKEKEAGILFENKEDKRFALFSIPEGFFNLPKNPHDNDIEASFSMDGLTVLIYQQCNKQILILDNPVQ